MTPPHGPTGTETLTVDLAAIRRDATWPVDPELVASFRASIRRGEPPLLDLSLNRIRLAEGAGGLEIIDGMHRLEALRLEGVATHGAKVRAYSPQDAFYARIATSLGKPNDLFRQRAERALRDGFVRDVAAHLAGATLYRRGVAEDGTPGPRRAASRSRRTRCWPWARSSGCISPPSPR
jgi:ParB-like chromosome segregation protein Spo0J